MTVIKVRNKVVSMKATKFSELVYLQWFNYRTFTKSLLNTWSGNTMKCF